MAVRVGLGDLFDSLGNGDGDGDDGGGDCEVFGGEIGRGVFFLGIVTLAWPCATRDHPPRESGSPERKSLIRRCRPDRRKPSNRAAKPAKTIQKAGRVPKFDQSLTVRDTT